MRLQRFVSVCVCVGLVGLTTLTLRGQSATVKSEWRFFGGDKGYKRYSPLDQINQENVGKLKVLWSRAGLDAKFKQAFPDLSPSNYLKSTPIIVDGVLYAGNAVGLVEAFDAATGKTLWVQEPMDPGMPGMAGQSNRGVDVWGTGADQRIISVRGIYLYALNAKSGRPYPNFGDLGRVSLKREELYAGNYRLTSGPLVVRDVIVIAGNGGGGGDLGARKEAAPEDVRGYDVRTGKLLWTFHVRPRPGEFGDDTWGHALPYSGDLGAWGVPSADEELGLVYVPLSAPTNAMFGGHRPGQNLYSNTLVCLDAKTGQRKWHFQMVHHDLWDYDNIGAPVLGDITVNGRRIKAVMQPNKTAFLYVFDRETGEPVWPIEERPVPQSDVPGEHTWPTQPFPTRPPPFDLQGLTEDDLIDFTPELKAEALALAKQYVIGPLFTPPSLVTETKKGTIVVPGTWGAGNWNTPSFDPETGIFYAASITIPYINDLEKPADARATMPYALKQVNPPLPPPSTTTTNGRGAAPNPAQQGRGDRMQRAHEPTLASGLPIQKPPYGRITALDLNKGTQVWMVPNGDGPRDHPLLKHLNLPPLGTPGRAAPLVTKTLLFIGEGSDAISGVPREGWGKKFRAYDKATGKVVWEMELPAGTTGGPMTYMAQGKQIIIVPIGGRNHPSEWIALGLP